MIRANAESVVTLRDLIALADGDLDCPVAAYIPRVDVDISSTDALTWTAFRSEHNTGRLIRPILIGVGGGD